MSNVVNLIRLAVFNSKESKSGISIKVVNRVDGALITDESYQFKGKQLSKSEINKPYKYDNFKGNLFEFCYLVWVSEGKENEGISLAIKSIISEFDKISDMYNAEKLNIDSVRAKIKI